LEPIKKKTDRREKNREKDALQRANIEIEIENELAKRAVEGL